MSRREKLYARLHREDAELRELFVMNLRLVVNGRNTMFFVLRDGFPTAPAAQVYTRAHDVLVLADLLDVSRPELVAAMVVETFEAANATANDHRLGPIRLAQKVLAQLEP